MEREDRVTVMLRQFFTLQASPADSAAGVWVAETDSLRNLIEKKYLTGYTAKPDEMNSQEIRNRLNSLKVYFRIEGDTLAMLSIVGDSFGVSSGRLIRRKDIRPELDIYNAVMFEKNKSINATVRHRKSKTNEKLEYEEDGLVISAVREMGAIEPLVAAFAEQIKSGPGLPQY